MGKHFDSLEPFAQAAVYVHVLRELVKEERGPMPSYVQPQRMAYLAAATETVAANPEAVTQVVSEQRRWIKLEGIDEQESFERVRRQIEILKAYKAPDGRST